MFPQDVTGGWAISKGRNKPRKRKRRDPGNRGATQRETKGRPRATAAQKAKVTKSPDLNRIMDGSRRNWGWGEGWKWQIIWQSGEQYWEEFYSPVEVWKKSMIEMQKIKQNNIHIYIHERKYRAVYTLAQQWTVLRVAVMALRWDAEGQGWLKSVNSPSSKTGVGASSKLEWTGS